MELRNQVEWALHCCAILASLPENAFLSAKDLAAFHGVPKEYLGKALQALSQNGITATTLGPQGGYRLARAPKDITFLAIVEAVEGRQSTFQCTEIRKNNPCLKQREGTKGICAVAKVMYRADEAWRKELSRVSLADLLADLAKDLPPALLERSGTWITERMGTRAES